MNNRSTHMRRRVENSLMRNGYDTPEKAAAITHDDFLDMRNIGIKGVFHLRDYLTEHGQPVPTWVEEFCEHYS